jgi:ribonuclease T2
MNRISSWICLLIASALLAACEPQQAAVVEPETKPTPIVNALPAAPGKFDFYVLALSWSPSYCEAEGTGANQQQCGAGRRYAFVVHGLWPQFERGYPTDCKTDIERVPEDLARSLYDIMPSMALIGHQWRRHGSCTGFDQDGYFATLRAARARIEIPEPYRRLDKHETVSAGSVEQAFMSANPGLSSDAISASCDKRLLREVRICLTRELGFRACPEVEKRSCRAEKLVMPPVRG